MVLKTPAVKPRRHYDASRRRRKAAATRKAIVEAARRRFLRDGYGPTTVAMIADDAGCSVETVYKGFGGKAGLVRAIWERGLQGAGRVPAERRSDAMRAAESDPRAIMRAWGQLTTEVAPLAAPIMLLARTAAQTDAELTAWLEAAETARLTRMEHNARDLLERGLLRPGVTLEEARDVLWTFSSPDLYRLLVMERGWPLERYGRFVTAGMMAELLAGQVA
jgi:AcrR family transcriptional regulator